MPEAARYIPAAGHMGRAQGDNMIKVGDMVPSLKLMQAGPDGPAEVSTDELLRGRRVVVFATPGAFTPTCSMKHVPGFMENMDALTAKGIDAVVCVAVNDVFVMGAWARDMGVEGRVIMLADGSGVLTKALGLELDLTARGLGVRSHRYAMVVEDGRVAHLAVEPPGGFDVSKAESLLAAL